MSKLKWLVVTIVLIVALPILSYHTARYTYYWGWWGRDNLLARALWLCSAPPELERSFYPETIEILVPACKAMDPVTQSHEVSLSPSRHYLIVRGPAFIDIKTGEKLPVDLSPVPGITYTNFYWLTDELVISHEHDKDGNELKYLTSLADKRSLRLPSIQEAHPELIQRDHEGIPHLDTIQLGNLLQPTDQIFATAYLTRNYATRKDHIPLMVVLSPDPWEQPEANFYIPGISPAALNEALGQKSLEYRDMNYACLYGGEYLSPDERFVANFKGILDADSRELLVAYPLDQRGNPLAFGICGWTADGRGVILARSGLAYALDESSILEIRPPYTKLPVPQPVLIFRLPSDYFATP